jgi:hypothetical protein
MALASIFRAQAPFSSYLGDVADFALQALESKSKAYPWHWQDLIEINGRTMADMRPIDFYDEHLKARIEIATEGEGVVGLKPYALHMPPGATGVLTKRGGWAIRLILDYSINRDSSVLKVDLARTE